MADSDQTLTGTGSSEFLLGSDGNDSLSGAGGADYILGDAGNDTIDGGAGRDYLRGGSGNDSIGGGSGNDVIRGDSGDDSIDGGTGNDLLLGDAGDDTIVGGTGNDTILGGAGDDSLTGGTGEDTFLFNDSSGNDTITDFDVDDDLINLQMLDETIADYNDFTITDVGNDVTITHTALGGTITLKDVSANDLSADNFMLPDPSVDSVEAGEEVEGEGATIVEHTDPIDGTYHSNFIIDGDSSSTINALGGADTIWGGEGGDTIYGGAGNDWLFGEEGNDRIVGGNGYDRLYGGSGDDTLKGGAAWGGSDSLYGDAGNDSLIGGWGVDILTGGTGADTFVFAAWHGSDVITDFDGDGGDIIDLSALDGISEFNDLTITYNDGDARIDLTDYDGGGIIVVEDVGNDALGTDDFVF